MSVPLVTSDIKRTASDVASKRPRPPPLVPMQGAGRAAGRHPAPRRACAAPAASRSPSGGGPSPTLGDVRYAHCGDRQGSPCGWHAMRRLPYPSVGGDLGSWEAGHLRRRAERRVSVAGARRAALSGPPRGWQGLASTPLLQRRIFGRHTIDRAAGRRGNAVPHARRPAPAFAPRLGARPCAPLRGAPPKRRFRGPAAAPST